MRERAQEAGALTVSPLTEVLGIDVEHGRVRRVRTTRGDIEAEVVVIACGVWSPRIARMAGRDDPAHAGGAPDDRRRAGAALRRRQVAHRLPDRARHGHQHVRAPGRRAGSRSARTPTARSCTTPTRSPRSRRRRSRRPSCPFTQADFDPQMEDALELMPEIVGDESRRREVRDQRPALADARRPAAPRRDARGQGPLVVRRRVGEGGAGHRRGRRRVDDPRRVRDRPALVRHLEASGITRRPAPTSGRARPRGSTRPTASSTRASSGGRTATFACLRSTRASASSAPSSSRRPAGSGRSGTSRTRRSSRSTPTG